MTGGSAGEDSGVIEGPAVLLRPLQIADAQRMLELYQRNIAFLAPWDPARPADFYTLTYQIEEIQAGLAAAATDRGYTFGLVLADSDLLIGRLRLSNIIRGAFQNAYLGYWIDEAQSGRGYMTTAVSLALRQAFSRLGLHRVQAATLPHNAASIAVLRHNGFRQEGRAERYLLIAGRWQDHLLFAVTAEEWSAWRRMVQDS